MTASKHFVCPGPLRTAGETNTRYLVNGLRYGDWEHDSLCPAVEPARGHVLPTTDSTIAPLPQIQRFSLTRVPWVLDTRKVALKDSFICFLVWNKGISNDSVGVARGTTVVKDQEIRPGAGFKTADLVKEKLGGPTVSTTPTVKLYQ